MPLPVTQALRARTLPDRPIARTARAPYQARRTNLSLGQGGVPGLSPLTGEAITQEEVQPEQVTEIVPPPILDEGEYLAASDQGTPPSVPVLQQGAQSDQVKSLQLSLRRLGYASGTIDGVYGPVTAQAVQHFQSDNNLPVTGAVDDTTLQAITSAVPAGSTSPAVPPVSTVAANPAASVTVPSATAAPAAAPVSTAAAAPATGSSGLLGMPWGFWLALAVLAALNLGTQEPPRPKPAEALRAE